MAEISVNVYSKEMAGYLSPNNAFYTKARKIVEAANAATFDIPQLSTPSSVYKGQPDMLPAKIKIATDDKKTGTMHQFWADPILITNESEVVTNYAKRQQHQMQQAAQIETAVANWAAYQWCPTTAGLIVATTGTARATSVTGLTGNRKAATKADMLNVAKVLRQSNIFGLPGKMYGLVTEDVYADLLALAEFVDYDKLGVTSKLELGILGRIAGMEIMSRNASGNHIGFWMNASNAKVTAVGTAATDRPVSIFWHESYVCYGDAPAQANITANAPGYVGGTLIEGWKRAGFDIIRSDEKGTVALVEVA
jgi:hypothetical protein